MWNNYNLKHEAEPSVTFICFNADDGSLVQDSWAETVQGTGQNHSTVCHNQTISTSWQVSAASQ